MKTHVTVENDLTRAASSGWMSWFEGRAVSQKKAWQYLILFLTLTAIYYCYFVRDAKANACPTDDTISFGRLGWLVVKFLVLTSWPFAIVAATDSEWRNKDAGNVFLAAYLFTNVLWYLKTGCAPCIFASAFRVIPYVFCALVAHGLGAVRHRLARAGMF